MNYKIKIGEIVKIRHNDISQDDRCFDRNYIIAHIKKKPVQISSRYFETKCSFLIDFNGVFSYGMNVTTGINNNCSIEKLTMDDYNEIDSFLTENNLIFNKRSKKLKKIN